MNSPYQKASQYNWDHYEHETLYDQIHGKGGFFLPDGAGVAGVAGAQDGWGKLAALMARARERTEAALAKAGAVWEGDTADTMRSGVTPLARWADDAHTAATASQTSTDEFVNSYSSAKNRMPEPVPVTSTANSDFAGIPAGFTHLFGGQTDQDKQEAAAQEAKAEAVRVMSGYESDSNGAQSSVGRFVPPPSVTVDVAPTQPKGGDVIPVGVSEWPGTGKGIDDGGRQPGDTRGPGTTPPPDGGSTPPPPGSTHTPPDGTTSPGAIRPSVTSPSAGTTVPPSVPLPANPAVTPGLGPEQYRTGSPAVPFGGFSTGGTFGGPGAGSAERGPVGGRGGPLGGVERGPGGLRGALPGGGGPAGEPVVGRAGAGGARGAGGMGMAPAGRAESDEDKEHKSAEYLIDFHDEFWDDGPPVAPAVIGDEDED